MSRKCEKLFRDPIHNVIQFDIHDDMERMLFQLVDTDIVQRLRHVRQLGLAWYVYHGAEHSRFGHSIGTQHLAKRIFDSASPGGDKFERAVTRAAALLHDIGHAAFSHAFETGISRLCKFSHEDMTCEIIMNPDSEVFRVLDGFDHRMPERVASCIAHETEAWYQPIVSSQLDADRMDYILRDGYMTGIRNYMYDVDRIIEMLDHDDEGLIVSYRAIHAVETYLISRYHMYQQVYHHKTVRGAEKMLEAIFRRVAFLASQGDESVFAVGKLGDLLRDIVSKHRVDPGLCMSVYDAHAWAALDMWRSSHDPILSDLSHSLLRRQFFKSIEISEEYKVFVRTNWQMIRDAVKGMGYDPDYYLSEDMTENRAFAPYQPEVAPLLPFIEVKGGGAHTNADIRVSLSSGRVVSIREASPIVDMMTNLPSRSVRICVCSGARSAVLKILKDLHVPL